MVVKVMVPCMEVFMRDSGRSESTYSLGLMKPMLNSYRLLPAISGAPAVSALCYRLNGDQSCKTQTEILDSYVVDQDRLKARIRACLSQDARHEFFDDDDNPWVLSGALNHESFSRIQSVSRLTWYEIPNPRL
jgi:hypothetical protein